MYLPQFCPSLKDSSRKDKVYTLLNNQICLPLIGQDEVYLHKTGSWQACFTKKQGLTRVKYKRKRNKVCQLCSHPGNRLWSVSSLVTAAYQPSATAIEDRKKQLGTEEAIYDSKSNLGDVVLPHIDWELILRELSSTAWTQLEPGLKDSRQPKKDSSDNDTLQTTWVCSLKQVIQYFCAFVSSSVKK